MESEDIRKAGLKVTLPRIQVLEILETSARRHMSAEEVYLALLDAGHEASLATVYRVLTQFETAGLVMRHNFEGGQSVFELDRGKHHDHLVCVKCGHVEEFVDDTIEKCQHKVAEKAGYELVEHSLVLYVDCKNPRCKRLGKR